MLVISGAQQIPSDAVALIFTNLMVVAKPLQVASETCRLPEALHSYGCKLLDLTGISNTGSGCSCNTDSVFQSVGDATPILWIGCVSGPQVNL